MKLTLVRHAKSSWDDPIVDDFDRTLNSRGQADAPQMGERLRDAGFKPDCVVTSPAVRVLETAGIIMARLGIPLERMRQEPKIYEASLATLQSVIEKNPDACRHLMLVGHNPGLEALCNYIQPGSVMRLTTCNIVQFALTIDHWREFDIGCGKLLSHWTPKD